MPSPETQLAGSTRRERRRRFTKEAEFEMIRPSYAEQLRNRYDALLARKLPGLIAVD